MKKIVSIFFVLFLAVFVVQALVAQDKSEEFKVSYWVNIDDGNLKRRFVNEFEKEVSESNEWNFVIDNENPQNADIHVVLSSISLQEVAPIYAWSISFVPIFEPLFNNSNVAISEANIGGVNWVARKTVRFMEEQMYIIADSLKELEEDEKSSKDLINL